jgi:hypothetical protein
MNQTEGNMNTVYVVQYDPGKDFSPARKFGDLKAVFNNVRKPYSTDFMIKHARSVLKDFSDGDSLLMVGDPALCGVCFALVAEINGTVGVLSWDRLIFGYERATWRFDDAVLYENEDLN